MNITNVEEHIQEQLLKSKLETRKLIEHVKQSLI